MRTLSTALITLTLTALLSACGGAAPQGASGGAPSGDAGHGDPLPAELQGEWHFGSVSPIEYYDPVSGKYAEASGTSDTLKFTAGGTYERVGITVVTSGSCTTKVLARNSGTVKLEGGILTLVPKTAHSEGCICNPSQTYERHDAPDSVNTWKVTGSGAQAVLSLGDPRGEARASLYNRPRGSTSPGGGGGGGGAGNVSGKVRVSDPEKEVLGAVVIMACPSSGTCGEAGDKWRFTRPGTFAKSTTFTIANVTDEPHNIVAWTDWNDNGKADPGDMYGVYTADGHNITPVTPPAADLDIVVRKLTAADFEN